MEYHSKPFIYSYSFKSIYLNISTLIRLNILIIFISFFTSVKGQDIHFSQVDHSPLNLNPALTGIFNGDIRFAGIYRNQWSSVPVPYLSFSGAYDTKLAIKALKKGSLSVGTLFNYDRSGEGDFNLSQLLASISYTIPLGEEHFFSLGFQTGGAQRAIDFTKLSFNQQYSGDIFDPNRPTGENFPQNNYFFFDLSTGFNWHYQQRDELFNLNAGVAIFHVHQPEIGFDENAKVSLNQRKTAYLFSNIRLTDKVDLGLGVSAQFQNTQREAILSSRLTYHISKALAREKALSIGANYRLGDAFIPKLGFIYQMWTMEFSYDINLSDFNIATNRRGGPELSLIYIIKKVQAVKSFKVCPIF